MLGAQKELPVMRFHGLIMKPARSRTMLRRTSEYTYDLWETLDVGGKKVLPQATRMLV